MKPRESLFLQLSCMETKWWNCSTEASRAPSTCDFTPLANSTARIDCESVSKTPLDLPFPCNFL